MPHGRKELSSARRIGHAEMAVKRVPEKTKSGEIFGQRRKRSKMFRVGLYARVSTQDQKTVPLQMRAMRDYAVTRGWTIALQVKEIGLRRIRTRIAPNADGGCQTARDRYRARVETG